MEYMSNEDMSTSPEALVTIQHSCNESTTKTYYGSSKYANTKLCGLASNREKMK